MSDIICLAINAKDNCDEKMKSANVMCEPCFQNMTREDCNKKPFFEENTALAKELTCYHLAYNMDNIKVDQQTGIDKTTLTKCSLNDICTDMVLAGSQVEMMKEMTKNL